MGTKQWPIFPGCMDCIHEEKCLSLPISEHNSRPCPGILSDSPIAVLPITDGRYSHTRAPKRYKARWKTLCAVIFATKSALQDADEPIRAYMPKITMPTLMRLK